MSDDLNRNAELLRKIRAWKNLQPKPKPKVTTDMSDEPIPGATRTETGRQQMDDDIEVIMDAIRSAGSYTDGSPEDARNFLDSVVAEINTERNALTTDIGDEDWR